MREPIRRIDDFYSQSRMAAVRRYTTLLEHLTTLKLHTVKVGELNIGHRQTLDHYFINVLGIANSTRHTYHKVIKTSLRYAQGYPNLFKMPEMDIYFNHKVTHKPRIKVSLKSSEIHEMIEAVNYNQLTDKERFATLLFLFSFSTMGMRFKDVVKLKWQDLKNGYIEYVMSKNQREMKVKLNERIVNILKYFLPKDVYQNPFYKGLEPADLTNSDSKRLYRLEEEYYSLKVKQSTTKIMGSIMRHKPDVNEDPKVLKVLAQRDELLEEIIIKHAKTARGFIFAPNLKETMTLEQLYNRVGSLNAIVNLDLKDMSRKLNIREFSFHSARHTFAYLSRQNKTDIYMISKCLGHSSLAITEQYLREFEDQEVYDANDKMVDFINQFYK
jgi:integrase